MCDLFVTSDVLMCTSSILHLCTISLERYIGIRYPLWTKNKSKRVVLLKIVLVWTIALAITSPITVLGVVSEENVLVQGECTLTNEHFIIYGSIFAFFIPLSIMVLMYALTVRMLNAQARLCQGRRADDTEGQPMIRRSTSRKNWQGRRQYYSGGGGRRRESERQDVQGSIRSYFGTQIPENEPSEDSNDGTSSTTMMMMAMANSVLPNSPSSTSPSKSVIVKTKENNKCQHFPVNRHNTLPLCHHKARNNMNRHSCQNGRTHNHVSGSTLNNIPTGPNPSHIKFGLVGNNKNNNNNNNSSNNTDHTDSGSRQHQGGYNPGPVTGPASTKLPGDYTHCNGHHHRPGDISPEPSSTPSSSSPSSSTIPNPHSGKLSKNEPSRLRDLVRQHHVAVKAANILLMKRDGHGDTSHQVIKNGRNGRGSDSTESGSIRHRSFYSKTLPPTPSSSTYNSVRRDNSVRTEQKASKVLGVVFMIFVICWAPFFTVNILTALCTSCRFERTLITAFVWLGYVSATLNPIIYTIFNNIFRSTFIKLLCCRYRLLHRVRRSSNMTGLRKGLLTCSTFCPAPAAAAANAGGNAAMTSESHC
ncbi:5-HT2 receptor [Elysia marginata]|uniref:5-HT2 receptor n=1 Tax=Elysia marginata TaxID=1093978 RepID=A0AAV4J6H6_9GAST|nr:5-HT2 receptor [Elysia marginata]